MRWPALPFLPSQCEVCRAWGGARLCGECLARFAPPVPRCRRCGLRLGAAAEACGRCLREPPPFESTVVAFDYGFPWDGLIVGFKFGGQVDLAGALAERLVQAVRGAAGPAVDWVLPVPLAPARLAGRGFNQAWELARRAAAALGLRSRADALRRALDTPQQAGLARAARERNLRAAFLVAPPARAALAGRRVALVDDVMTTGATARECALALRRGGAAAVDLWVLARTPEPGAG